MDTPSMLITESLGQWKQALAALSTPELEELEMRLYCPQVSSLDRALIDLDGFKDIDGILSRPQFCNLQRINVIIGLDITDADISIALNKPPAPSGANAVTAIRPISPLVRSEISVLHMRVVSK